MSFRWLKLLADWLDNRFPAKVHVTDAAFQDLLRRETERTQRANTQESEILALVQSLNRLSVLAAEVKYLKEQLSHIVKGTSENHEQNVRRIDELEGTLGAIKEVVTKATAPESQAAARRAAFIASGRMPE